MNEVKRQGQGMNGGSTISVPEWMKVLFSNNPAFLLLVVAFLWIDGRIQSPEEKRQHLLPLEMRIQESEKDLQKLESLMQTHQQLGGHMEMDLRMKTVEKWIDNHKMERNVGGD